MIVILSFLLKVSLNSGTSRKFDIYTPKQVQFCSERNFSPYETTINQILLFLYDLFQSRVGFSVINTARSSLSTFTNIDGIPVGQQQSLLQVFNMKPALLNQNITQDVGIVITHISKLETNSLKIPKSKASYTVGVTAWPELRRDIIGVGRQKS